MPVTMGEYQIEMGPSGESPLQTHVEISFTPNKKSPATEEIQFIQVVKPAVSGTTWTALHKDQADLEKYTTEENQQTGVKGGYHVDIDPRGKTPHEPGNPAKPFVWPDYPHLKRMQNPSQSVPQPGGLVLSGGGTFGGPPQTGYHRPPDVRAAVMTDDPGGGPLNGFNTFETVAYDKRHGFGYGTVYWSFYYDMSPAKGKPHISNEQATVKEELSPTFIDAVRRFQKFYKS